MMARTRRPAGPRRAGGDGRRLEGRPHHQEEAAGAGRLPSPAHRLRRQLLAVQDDVGTHGPPAVAAGGPVIPPGDRFQKPVRAVFPAAALAAGVGHGPVNLNHVRRASRLVEPVHILGDEGLQEAFLLKAGQHPVGLVGPGIAQGPHPGHVEGVELLRPGLHPVDRPQLGGMALPQPSGAPVVGDAPDSVLHPAPVRTATRPCLSAWARDSKWAEAIDHRLRDVPEWCRVPPCRAAGPPPEDLRLLEWRLLPTMAGAGKEKAPFTGHRRSGRHPGRRAGVAMGRGPEVGRVDFFERAALAGRARELKGRWDRLGREMGTLLADERQLEALGPGARRLFQSGRRALGELAAGVRPKRRPALLRPSGAPCGICGPCWRIRTGS